MGAKEDLEELTAIRTKKDDYTVATMVTSIPKLGTVTKEKISVDSFLSHKDILDIDHSEMEQRWKRYVEEAKPHILNMTKARMAVAEIAIKACTIHYGGGDHWKNFSGVYTMKRFAQAIGMNYKTLSGWCSTYRNVLKKLPDGVYDETNYEAARRVANKVDRNTPTEQVEALYKKELSSSREREYLVKGIKRLKTLHYYITVKAYIPTLEKEASEELDELHKLCMEIVSRIELK